MVQLLGEWSETFPYDFRDERMMVGVRTMTHRCIALQPSLRRDVTQVRLSKIWIWLNLEKGDCRKNQEKKTEGDKIFKNRTSKSRFQTWMSEPLRVFVTNTFLTMNTDSIQTKQTKNLAEVLKLIKSPTWNSKRVKPSLHLSSIFKILTYWLLEKLPPTWMSEI